MNIEVILTPLILALAAAFLVAGRMRSQRAVALTAIGAGGVLLAVVLGMRAGFYPYPPEEREVASRPVELLDEDYVSSDTCRACHPHEYETWKRSYHSTMTQVASPESVIPDFDVELQSEQYSYRLQRLGDEFWVDTDDPALGTRGQPRIQRQVVMTTGSHHAQLFWVETDHGRKVELLPFGYRIAEQRWIPFLSAFLVPKTGVNVFEASWSRSCMRCHVTDGRARVQGKGKADTHVGELGITCEACHGPGQRHIELNRDPLRRYELYLSDDDEDSSIVQPARLSRQRSSEVCGQCHSLNTAFSFQQRARHLQEGSEYRPGDELARTRNVLRKHGEQIPFVQEVLRKDPAFLEHTFWSDGEAAISGREYNGLIESPCYIAGELSCFSCHTLHQSPDDPRSPKEWADDQVTPGMHGDQACLQCHEGFADRIEEHTHHRAGSAGSECQNCHMPNTAYALLKATRSHKITSPSVATSLETGRPNACNLCHLDKTLAWTASAQQQWYGMPIPELSQDEREIAASLLWLLRGHAGQRALIAWGMSWEPALEASGSDWMTPFLSQLLEDPYDANRFLSARTLQGLPGYEQDVDPLGPTAALTRAKWMAVESWSRRQRSGDASAATLIDGDGELDEQTLARLLSQRDDRPVYRPE